VNWLGILALLPACLACGSATRSSAARAPRPPVRVSQQGKPPRPQPHAQVVNDLVTMGLSAPENTHPSSGGESRADLLFAPDSGLAWLCPLPAKQTVYSCSPLPCAQTWLGYPCFQCRVNGKAMSAPCVQADRSVGGVEVAAQWTRLYTPRCDLCATWTVPGGGAQ
jgi:hypothetical protein